MCGQLQMRVMMKDAEQQQMMLTSHAHWQPEFYEEHPPTA